MPSIHEADDLYQSAAPFVVIYGEPGVGKTSLALEFPDPFFLSLENGLPKGTTVKGFGPDKLPDLHAVFDTLRSLYEEQHEFKTVVIDTASVLQNYILKEVKARAGGKALENISYGKGYVMLSEITGEVINWLTAINDTGISIVILAHSDVKRYDDPETVSYDKLKLKLDKRIESIINETSHCILCVKRDIKVREDDEESKFNNRVHAEGGQTRWIHTDGRAAFTAKNRYKMPPRILYEEGSGYAALSQYFYS